jgi:hypothetical protein
LTFPDVVKGTEIMAFLWHMGNASAKQAGGVDKRIYLTGGGAVNI